MTLKQSFFVAILCCIATFAYAQTWTKAADFPGVPRLLALSFTLGNFGYIGSGIDEDLKGLKDFYKYDPATNKWTKIADFPGEARVGAIAMVINGKAYVGLGQGNINNYLLDFYEYDPATDKWTAKANFPKAEGRINTVAFGLDTYNGGTGFVTMGAVKGSSAQVADLMEYTPATNTWKERPNVTMPDGKANGSFNSFVVNGKVYITGFDAAKTGKKIYQFDPSNATTPWKEVAKNAEISAGSTTFVIDNKAYICYGENAVVLEFDATNNSIKSIKDPLKIGGNLGLASSFSLGKAGYLFGGFSQQVQPLPYSPLTVWKMAAMTSAVEISNDDNISIYPTVANDYLNIVMKNQNDVKGTLNLLSANGQLLQSKKVSDVNTFLSVSDLANGFYIVQYQTAEKTLTKRVIVQH